ncbi:uroporphyrinogen-III synthase [Rhizobiaceae bacterium n13]|uniref:Uroporphyrinogen-III synthase n=1 Tax=Ferirhizobium litorale TaxID=2927786 RepID=A0AAE3QHM4_9HYPH|nr:uroporphyrinogen-III synthase [Fererhizobium litorale]MDI7862453.1 uroporphyrinogen-III synthase [Fererhizobium litorale]MDI7923660.1 uroporphyrinogen-III synthase [Fererhizobium litorale]
MRVIVTRPELAARRTARRLESLGHTALLLPLAEPVHDPLAVERSFGWPHATIAVTSAEAVRAMQLLGRALSPHLDTTLFSVGSATSNAAIDAGFRNVVTSDGGGRELGYAISDRFTTHGRPSAPLIYIAGEPRSSSFEERLAALGIRHLTVCGYRMKAVSHHRDHLHSLLVEGRVDAVLFYSRETAERFFSLPVFADNRQILERSIFLCLSPNIANAVPGEYANSTVVATTPNEDCLLDLL